MPIAKLKREKRKDPLWGIILYNCGVCPHDLSTILRHLGLATIVHAYDYVVLGCVPANMVWGVVRIWYGDFYRSIA